jgi:hypothetical protein
MKLAPLPARFLLTASAIVASLAVLAAPTRAQQQDIPKTTAESVGGILRYTEDQFLSVAEAMPAEKYSYIPSAAGGKFDGVRSFAEHVKHLACANFAFFNEIEGKTSPEGC